jgi:2-keto-3-deoxy-L-rhamnonate aldolase RhmA
MKSAQILRQKINSNALTLGILATNHFWIDLIEISKNAGLDYLIIDQEHNAFDEEKVSDACALARLIDFPVLIRPPEAQYSFIRRAADKGCVGFLLPTVEDTKQLDEVRDAIYMPPRGKRRPGGPGNRWAANFNYETWRDTVECDFIVLPQIENLKGLSNVEAIARHEVTTAMAIGPYDLSANLGVCWQPTNPKLLDAQEKIRAAGKAAGKNMWMIGDAPTLIQRGFSFLCVTEPSGFLEAMLKNFVGTIRGGQPAVVKTDKVD